MARPRCHWAVHLRGTPSYRRGSQRQTWIDKGVSNHFAESADDAVHAEFLLPLRGALRHGFLLVPRLVTTEGLRTEFDPPDW